jgi:hypothetical protein
MRFSIKWLLAAMAYVALVAAAAKAEYGVLADAPWAVLLLCFCYSLILVGVTFGERHARAVGFTVACAAHFAVVYAAIDHTLAAHALRLAGYSVTSAGRVIEVAGPNSIRTAQGVRPILNSSNAVATLAAGLIGSYVGALVFRRDERHRPPI